MKPSVMQNMNDFLPTGMKLEVVDEKCEMKKWKCCLNEPLDHQDQICWQIDNGMHEV